MCHATAISQITRQAPSPRQRVPLLPADFVASHVIKHEKGSYPSSLPSSLLPPFSQSCPLPHSSLLGTRESVVRTEPEFRGGSLFLAPLIARSPLSPGPAISQPPDPSLSPNGVAKDAWYYTPNGFCLQSRVKPTLHFMSREQKLLSIRVWFLCALFRPILGGRRHDTTPKIKGYWYIGALVETWETDHRVACKIAR